MTTTLTDLQNIFLNAIFDTDVLLDFIQPQIGSNTAEQFQIYKNNIFAQMSKALQNIYPVCERLVGEAFFRSLSRHYILKKTSTFSDLNEYGEFFADVIDAFESAKCLPYLPDVARFEWAWHKLYNAADATEFSYATFATSAVEHPEKIVFLLTPGSTLLQSAFPIHAIWSANVIDTDGDDIVVADDQAFFYFFCRLGLERKIISVSKSEYQFLLSIQTNSTLSELSNLPNAEIFLKEFIQNLWISGFDEIS